MMPSLFTLLVLATTGALVAQADEPTTVLAGATDAEIGPHRAGNVYAPEIHRSAAQWLMWYGGQGRDGRDRILLATSRDNATWTRVGVVIDEQGINHQNDPSVVRVGKTWWMFYTRAAHGISDEIAAATSQDGVRWTPQGVVLRPAAGRWDSLVVSRPSVLHEGGTFRMWYDARGLKPGAGPPASDKPEALLAVAGPRAVGLAESQDGIHWQRIGTDPVFGDGAGGIHVCRHGKGYVMLYESHEGTRWATSPDGVQWSARGMLLPKSGRPEDAGGHVTPFLLTETSGNLRLYFGSNGGDWSRNRIASTPIEIVLPEK